MKEKLTYTRAIQHFNHFLFVEGCAASTASAYANDMNLFRTFLIEHLNNKIRYLDNITCCEIQQYKDYLYDLVQNGRYDAATVHRKFNTLKTFFRYLNKTYGIPDIIKGDQWGNKKTVLKFKLRAGKAFLPQVLESKDVDILIDCIYSSTDKNKYRDLALITCLITTGARRSDILNLRWSDINFFRDELKLVHIKNCNGGVVMLPPALKTALTRLLKLSNLTDEYIFKSRQGSSLSESAFNNIISKWVQKSGIESNYTSGITSHSFRHTFITNCIRQDISLDKIIEYTGHTSTDGLSPYVHLVPKDHSPIANMHNSLFASLAL